MLAFKVVVYLSVAIPIMMMDDINAISKKLILAIITSIFILSISKYRLFNKFIKSLMLLCIIYFPFKFILIYNNKNLKIFSIILIIICVIIFIKILFNIVKDIKDIIKKERYIKQEEKRKRMMIEQEEKIEKIINNFRELIKGLENDEVIALLEIEIPKLQEGETKEIYKKGLSKLYDAKHREEERLRREKEEEEERIRIEKEKEEERTRIKNEVKDNVENNRFVETNMPLIAEEGCFVMLDNIEYYEYRTKYGATNYEKVGEGKVYITNKRLYFITEINAFHLIWLEHIMDINWYENKNQLKITRDGNAIFLESYDEVDIYKMYYYIKTIMKNK